MICACDWFSPWTHRLPRSNKNKSVECWHSIKLSFKCKQLMPRFQLLTFHVSNVWMDQHNPCLHPAIPLFHWGDWLRGWLRLTSGSTVDLYRLSLPKYIFMIDTWKVWRLKRALSYMWLNIAEGCAALGIYWP